MSEIKPRLTNGEALALARENRKRVDDAMQAEVERDAQGCKDEITELRSALAASQEEVERLAKRLEVRLEAEKLCDKMSQGDMRSLVDEVNTERTRAESAESALKEARGRIAELEQQYQDK